MIGSKMGLGRLELPTSRLSANLTVVADHGKKSSKFLQDCTICASCREVVIGPIGLEYPENRVE